jgi:hypothetical protein
MEEQNTNRVNVKRTLQLIDAIGVPQNGNGGAGGAHAASADGATGGTIASACPFCMTMLTDGLKAQGLEDRIALLDVAELLERSCALDEPLGVRAAMPKDPPRVAPAALH